MIVTLDESFVRRIENPDDERLRTLLADAMKKTRERLQRFDVPELEERLIRRLAYTYYYDWENDDPRFLFVVQDPGNLQRRHLDELDRFRDAPSIREQIQGYRRFATTWLINRRNADFSERFLGTLHTAGLIDIRNSWSEYVASEQFFDDIYLGDVVKYRTDGFGKRAERASFQSFLDTELRAIDPDLIVAFGGNAWSTLRRELAAKSVDDPDIDDGKIMQAHGHVYNTENTVETSIIPLGHMSGQVWWRFPPDEYIDRLQKGVERWKEFSGKHV